MKDSLDGIDFFDFSRINQQRQIERGVQDTLSELVNKQWSQHGLPDRELPGRLPELETRYQQAYNNTNHLRDRKKDGKLLRDTPKGQIFQQEVAHHLGATSLLGAYLQLDQDEQHYLLQQRHKDKNDPLQGEKPWTQRFKHNGRIIDLNTLIYTTKQLQHELTHDYQDKELDKNHFSRESDLNLHKYHARLAGFKTLRKHSTDDAIRIIQQTHPEATQNYQYSFNLDEALQAFLKHQPETNLGPTTPENFLEHYNLHTGEKTKENLEGAKFTHRYKKTEVENFQTWLKNQHEQGNILNSTWQQLTQTKGWQKQTTPDGELAAYEAKKLTNDLQHYIRSIPADKSLMEYQQRDEATKNFTGRLNESSPSNMCTWLREKREQGSIPPQTWNKLLQAKNYEGYKEHFYQLETRPAITPWPVTLDDAPKHSQTNQIRQKDELRTLKHLINGNTDEESLDLATKITYNNAANAPTTIDEDDRTKGEIFQEDIAPRLGPTTLLQAYLDLDADQQTYLLKQRQKQINDENGDLLGGNVYGGNYYQEQKTVSDLPRQLVHTKRLEQELQERTPNKRQQLNLRKNRDETPFPAHKSLYLTISTTNIEGFVKNIERRNPEAVEGYQYQPLLKEPEQENPHFTELYDNVLQSDTEPALI